MVNYRKIVDIFNKSNDTKNDNSVIDSKTHLDSNESQEGNTLIYLNKNLEIIKPENKINNEIILQQQQNLKNEIMKLIMKLYYNNKMNKKT